MTSANKHFSSWQGLIGREDTSYIWITCTRNFIGLPLTHFYMRGNKSTLQYNIRPRWVNSRCKYLYKQLIYSLFSFNSPSFFFSLHSYLRTWLFTSSLTHSMLNAIFIDNYRMRILNFQVYCSPVQCADFRIFLCFSRRKSILYYKNWQKLIRVRPALLSGRFP